MEDGSVTMYDGVRVSNGRISELNGELARARLIASHVEKSVLERHIGPEFSTHAVTQAAKPLTIALRGMELLEQPIGGSPGSDARYLLVCSDPPQRELLLLQHIPPKGKTSVHWHPQEFEDFLCVRGSCELYTGTLEGDQARLERILPLAAAKESRPSLVYVPPKQVHQLRTSLEEAYNVIRIRNTTATTLREIDHRYTEWRLRI